MIRGSTELVAIVGSPIAQVKSPENFNTWFASNGCDLAMLPIDLQETALEAFVGSLRGWQNLRGCVVTVPYKQALANRVDGLSERAAALGSVNVIRRERDGRLLGDNVDGAGFLGAAHKHGFEPAGKRALVIGCGGVGSAIAGALVVGILSMNINSALVENPTIPAALIEQVDLDRATFVSNVRLLGVMSRTTATSEQVDEAVRINAEARLKALKLTFLLMAALALFVIVPSGRLPGYIRGQGPSGQPPKV